MSLETAHRLIEQRLGLSIAAQQRLDPERTLRLLAGDDLPGFVARLAASNDDSEVWQAVVRAFTIGETYFFRDHAHFGLLRERVLPGLIAERRQRDTLYLNLWSVGCATGEEAYSLAILLHELLPDRAAWKLNLIASDLNATALEAARRAVYRPWSFRQADPALQRYFDGVEGGVQLQPHLRALVRFVPMNLLKGPPALPGGWPSQFDLILCRNVLLYFSDARAVEAEALFYDALTPGGWLLLGKAETMRQRDDGWVYHAFPDAPIYQRATTARRTTRLPVFTLDAPAPTQPPAPTPDQLYEAAVQARRAGDAPACERTLRDLLARQPTHPCAHLLLAGLHADQQRLTQAHTALDRALTHDPLLADGHYLRGLLYLEEARPDDAQRALRAALYCQPGHPLASFTLGMLLARQGGSAQAQRLWERARRAIAGLSADAPLSDLSDLTVGRLDQMIGEQIAALTPPPPSSG